MNNKFYTSHYSIEPERYEEFKRYMAKKLSQETGRSYTSEDILIWDTKKKTYYTYKESDHYKYIFGGITFDYAGDILSGVEFVDGNVDFVKNKIKEIRDLKYIMGSASFSSLRNLESLGSVKYVGRDAYFGRSGIKDLGDLEEIGECANFVGSHVLSLGKVKRIGRDLVIRECNMQDLGCLESIGWDADFRGAKIKSFGKLRSIGGYADFSKTHLKSLENIEYIGGGLNISDSDIKDLGNLQYVGGRILLYEKQKKLFADKIFSMGGMYCYLHNNSNYENEFIDKDNKPSPFDNYELYD